MIYRYATEKDIGDIANIHVICFKNVYKDIFPRSYLNNLTPFFWKKAISLWLHEKKIQVLLACEGQEIIGFIIFGKVREDNLIQIVSFYILKDFRDKGIGSILFNAALNNMKKNTYSVAVWVVKKNIRACHFYEKKGFINANCDESIDIDGVIIELSKYILLI